MSKNDSLSKYITHINVRGVFEDPEEAARFTHCDGTPCYTDNDKYPLNRWMVDYMKAEILNLNFNAALQAVEDTSNNAKADNNNEAK